MLTIDISEFPDEFADLANAAEGKLRQIEAMVADGVLDWTDEDDALLIAWRHAVSSAGEWGWWGREIGGDVYEYFGDTRDQVIERARAELGPDVSFEIVEANHWQDDIRCEEALFAETRNHEVIAAEGAEA